MPVTHTIQIPVTTSKATTTELGEESMEILTTKSTEDNGETSMAIELREVANTEERVEEVQSIMAGMGINTNEGGVHTAMEVMAMMQATTIPEIITKIVSFIYGFLISDCILAERFQKLPQGLGFNLSWVYSLSLFTERHD